MSASTQVKLVKFEVTPRKECCWGRYAEVRLIADSKTVAITPNPYVAKTSFDILVHANGEPPIGTEFRLDWTATFYPAQVEWIEITYKKVLPPVGKFSISSNERPKNYFT